MSAMFKRRAIELDDAPRMVDAYAGIPIRLMDIGVGSSRGTFRTNFNVYAYDAYVKGAR